MRYSSLFFSLSKKPLIGLAATATLAASAYTYYQYSHHRNYPSNLYNVLDYYGFSSPEQKQALRYLMQKSGIKNTDILLDHKAQNQEELSNLILELVKETQDKFTIRNNKQERWDVQTSEWMRDREEQEQILRALKTLKMVDAIPKISKNTQVIVVLGASKSTMVLRLKYAEDLLMENKLSAKWLALLTGERYVTPDKNNMKIDGSEQELSLLANKLGKHVSHLTETDLMRQAYENSKLCGKFTDHFVLIDTPKGDLPRPTTETTVSDFCEWLKQRPEIQEVTFVSNQPHVEYQKAIIAQVLQKQAVNVRFEVIGPECNINSILDNNADQINYIVQALGSRIWAATPEVIDAIGLDMSDPKLKANYLEIYKKQPLIYKNLENKFSKPKP